MRNRNGRWSAPFVLIATLCLWANFALRLHNIDTLPLFLDETIVVGESKAIASGTFLHHASFGKFALPYFLLPFQPTYQAAWIIRVSLLIWTCLGFSSGLAIARRYGGLRAALVAAALMAFSPMLFFFDRLALGDTMAHAAVTLWFWSLLQLFGRQSPRYSLACVSGILFVVCLLAKATSLLLLPLPLVMAVLMAPWAVSSRAKVIACVYLTGAILCLPFSIALSSRNLDYFWQYGNFGASAGTLLSLARLGRNLSFLLEALISYHGLAFLAVSAAACLLAGLLKPRIMLSIYAGAIGYCFAIIWFSDDLLFGRFFIPVLPLYFVGASIAISALARSIRIRVNLRTGPIIFACLALWVYTVSLPFLNALYVDPASADLFRVDKSEYIRNESSGYGVPELAQYLVDQTESGQSYVVGAFIGCETLRLYLPPPRRNSFLIVQTCCQAIDEPSISIHTCQVLRRKSGTFCSFWKRMASC